MTNATHALFLVHRTQPGRREEVEAVWRRHMPDAVAANPDHLAYAYCADVDDPDVLRVVQMYTSADAAAAFLQQPAYLAYLDEVEPLLSGPPEVHTAVPRWTKAVGPA